MRQRHQAPVEKRAALPEPGLDIERHGDGHGIQPHQPGERGRRHQVLVESAVGAGALNPHVTGAEPVSEGEQDGQLPVSSINCTAGSDDMGLPAESDEVDRRAGRHRPWLGEVSVTQEGYRAQQGSRGWRAVEAECLEEPWRPSTHRAVLRAEHADGIGLVGPHEAARGDDDGAQVRPVGDAGDRLAEIAALLVGGDQLLAQPYEQPERVAPELGLTRQRLFATALGRRHGAAEQGVDHLHRRVGQIALDPQQGGDEDGVTPRRRHLAQGLGAVAAAFPREPPKPSRRRVGDNHRIQGDTAHRLKAVDERV